MSLPTVRAGGTNPREIERLVRRGVKVFTRRNLHAKIVVADKCVIAGSANISKQSRDVLDEAGILTNDPAVVRRAREFIEKLCTEPVRTEYLQECKRAYRPPRFRPGVRAAKAGQRRATHAKLWLVKLRESSVPESEADRYEKGEQNAQRLLKAPERSKIESFHWPYKPKMADELEAGDWIIQALTYKDKSIVIYPASQLLFVDSYDRDPKKTKKRWVFHLEMPNRGETLTWQAFQKTAKPILKNVKLTKPRTMPFRDLQTADGLLRLWTARGRIAHR